MTANEITELAKELDKEDLKTLLIANIIAHRGEDILFWLESVKLGLVKKKELPYGGGSL